ncbi:M28 family peptidase [Acidianus sp. DSM 29099]|nr:M28 family peptidase [Acidianus sp. RZ1]NON62718.1 M28 family peptidase [Acidianus sp. RZ1]
MVFERLKLLSTEGEIITGSKEEGKIIDKIKAFFHEVSDEVRVTPIMVMNWKQRDLILECSGRKIDASLFPYSPSVDLETEVSESYELCNNKMLKVKINNLFEVNKYYEEAIEKGCNSVVFSLDDEIRRFVIKNGNLLSTKPSPPPYIPAIYVKLSDFQLVKGKCRLLADSEFNQSTGYIVEGIKNAKYNEEIHVTAHHDHWLAGERDNLLAVSILPELTSDLYETHLISFTAEESGSLSFSPFSWSYGSRKFLQGIRTDNVLLNINMDNLAEDSLTVKLTPGLRGLIENEVNVLEIPEIYTDSYSYVKSGIPSVNIGSYSMLHYHGEFDVVNPGDPKLNQNIELTKRLILKVINSKIEYNFNEMVNYLDDVMKSLPLPLRSYLVNVEEKIRERNERTYRNLLRFYGGILYDDFADVKLFHKIFGSIEARKRNKVCIEDYGCIKKERNDEIYNKQYEYFINTLIHEINNEYIEQIYLI